VEKVEMYAVVNVELSEVYDILGDIVDYGSSTKELSQAQKDLMSFDNPDSLKIVKIMVEDIAFDWRADVEAAKTDDAMNRMKESVINDIK